MHTISEIAINQIIKSFTGLIGLFILGHVLNLLIKSEKLEKALSVRNFIFAFTVSVIGILIGTMEFANKNQGGWDSESVKVFEQQVFTSVDSLGLDKGQKKEFTDCCLSKLKLKFPQGIAQIPQDSVNRFGKEIGKECYRQLANKNLSWTKKFEELMKTYYMNAPELQKVDTKIRAAYIDCLIEKLKIKYPAGLDHKLPDIELQPIIEECVASIKK